ncbi:hypothetical protein ACFLVM_02080 [Chloroflexota bacterium]
MVTRDNRLHPKRIRRIRIYFAWRGGYYSFCWIEFLQNGSLSLGFLSRVFNFTEYGSAIARSGHFTEHAKILTRGNVDIKNADSPHITFHPPNIRKNGGIVHMISKNGLIDEFELDWFPVKKSQTVLYAFTGDIGVLDRSNKAMKQYQIISVPSNLKCLRMELAIYPRSPKYPKPANFIHIPDAIGNIHGGCPYYVVSCYFYENDMVEPALYLASDSYVK